MSFCFDSILKHDEFTTVITLGIKEWRSGESARLPPMRPGFKFRRRRHIWVEFVVGSLLCSERFFCGYSSFPVSSKPNIYKFQFDQESDRRRTALWMCYLQIIIYLFIYLFIYLNLSMSYLFQGACPTPVWRPTKDFARCGCFPF